MTREEEKELASEEYLKSTLVGSPYIKKTSFKSGVEWADEHPRKGLVDIDKVCNYLDRLLYYDDHDGMLKCNFTDFDEFISDLRKSMEEQL